MVGYVGEKAHKTRTVKKSHVSTSNNLLSYLVSEKKGRHELGSGYANFGCLWNTKYIEWTIRYTDLELGEEVKPDFCMICTDSIAEEIGLNSVI